MTTNGHDFATLVDVLSNRTMRVADKPWGCEYILETHNDIKIKIIKVDEGHATSLQYHDHKQEFLYILDTYGSDISGVLCRGTLHAAGDRIIVNPLDVHRSIGPVLLLEVTNGDDNDITRMEDAYGREFTRGE